MTNRITNRDLEGVVRRINALMNTPETPWTKRTDGKPGMTANIGNYHLSGAYGGVSLHQMQTEGGGIRDVFGCGHVPKRDLFDRMHAFIQAIYIERERAERAA